MIYGIGTDIIQISRIAKVLERKGEKFEKRILGIQETQSYLRRKEKSKKSGNCFLANRFSAKEAFSKALGLGMKLPITWHGVQILNDDSGKPIIVIGSVLKEYMKKRKLIAHVSITDEIEYSVALVVIEKVLGLP
jgi:holo-[acyl-carrier protein] synthase